MKLIVRQTFRDKTDHVTMYHPGSVIEIKDLARAHDLIERGLCEESRPQQKVKKAPES